MPLISVPSGRFPGEKNTVHSSLGTASANRTAKGSICRISAFFAEIKASFPRAPNASAGVAALHYNQLVLTIKKNFFSAPDASRDKPERSPLSVLSLRLPRSRAFARWSLCREAHFVIGEKTCSL